MEILQVISDYAIPLLLLGIPALGLLRGVKVYESFVEGAKQGFQTAVGIIPFLVAMFIAVEVFKVSGAMDLFLGLVRPVASLLGIPRQVIPMAVVRPLSGSGALGILAHLLQRYGPDSPIGILASVMQGSTETTLYVLTVYFGAVGIKNTRHALGVGLIADLVGFLAAVFFAGMVCF